MPGLKVGGVEPFTTIDFPGRLAAVIFCRGCPWRCPYCHNPDLQEYAGGTIPWDGIMDFLGARSGFLDGVVFSGGEPTAQPSLEAAIRAVHDIGFAIGLHTGGMFPRRLTRILPHLDWVGLDIKAPLDHRYDALVGRKHAARSVAASLDVVRDSGVRFTLRTTIDPDWIGPNEQEQIVADLAARGFSPPDWQTCRKIPAAARQD